MPLQVFKRKQYSYEKQFGFQSEYSTNDATVQLLDKIFDSFEKEQFTLGVFIDLSKAFDTLIVCFYHVTYEFESESTFYSCLNVKELLARSRRHI